MTTKKTVMLVVPAAVAAVGVADQFAGMNLRAKVGLGSVSPWLFILAGAAALYYVHSKA